jgi:hypothetical protein
VPAEGTRVVADLVASVKSYVMLFAEGTKQLNFSLVPRMADIAEHLKGAAVSGHNVQGPAVVEIERDELAESPVAVWPGRS